MVENSIDIFGRRKQTSQNNKKKSYYTLNDLIDVKEFSRGKEDSLYCFKYLDHSYIREEIFFPETIEGIPENVPLILKKEGNKFIFAEEDSERNDVLNDLEEDKRYEIIRKSDSVRLVEKIENSYNHNMKDNFVYKLNETVHVVFVGMNQIYFQEIEPNHIIFRLLLYDQIYYTNKNSDEDRKFVKTTFENKKYIRIEESPDSSDLFLLISSELSLLYYLPEGTRIVIKGKVIKVHSNKLIFVFDKNKVIGKSYRGIDDTFYSYQIGEDFTYRIERPDSEHLIVLEETRNTKITIGTRKEYIDKIYISPDIIISEIYMELNG